MSVNRKVMIITLLCVNIALVGTLVLTSIPKAQAQQGTPFPATNYIAVTTKVNKNLDALCVIDLATQQMAVWKWNEGRNRLEAECSLARLRVVGAQAARSAVGRGSAVKLTADQARQAVRLYRGGMALRPIAQLFGVSYRCARESLMTRIQLRTRDQPGERNTFYRGAIQSDRVVQGIFDAAVKRGDVVRQDVCEECGDDSSRIEGHHDDYGKPLSVRWLCRRCHYRWHQHNTARKRGA